MNLRGVFEALPGLVVLLDRRGYVVEINRPGTFDGLRPHTRFSQVVPVEDVRRGRFERAGRHYTIVSSQVVDAGEIVGEVLWLSDVTAIIDLTERLDARVARLRRVNAELTEASLALAGQMAVAADAADETRRWNVARYLHDRIGHAMTVVEAIARMCPLLAATNPQRCAELLTTAIALCEEHLAAIDATELASPGPSIGLADLLEQFASVSPLPIDLVVGAPETLAHLDPALVALVWDTCTEALANTLRHAAGARSMSIVLTATRDVLTLRVADDGAGSNSAGANGAGSNSAGANRPDPAVVGQLAAPGGPVALLRTGQSGGFGLPALARAWGEAHGRLDIAEGPGFTLTGSCPANG